MPNDTNALRAFDYTALMERLHPLADTYPFVTLSYIGTSILDRAIPILHIGSGSRRVLYVGAHHGMEWITSLLLTQFLEELCQAIKAQKRVCGIYPCDLLEGYTISIIPMLNPDGVEYQIHGVAEDNPLRERLLEMNGGNEDFSFWQANARGVDLNHNYDAGFTEYKSIEARDGISAGRSLYSGESPESEPETRGVANVVRTLMPYALVSLHTQGEEIYAFPRTRKTLRCAERLAQLTGYRVSTPDGTAGYGGLSDYSATLGIPSFTIELGKGVNPLSEDCLPDFFTRVADAVALLPTLL